MKTYFFIIAFIFVSLVTTYKSKAQNASFNYNTSTGTVGTTYSWIDCSTDGTLLSISGEDDDHTAVSWPFNFSFYDDNYTTSNSLSVSTNGFIRLDGEATDSYTTSSDYDITSGNELGQVVCLGVNDCNTSDNVSNIYYRLTGASPNRIFTIEYVDLEIYYNDGLYADLEVQFYETSNKIVILFGNDNVTQTSADIGIHSGNNSYRNHWQDVDDGTNNTWIEYTVPAKVFNGITYNQASTTEVSPGQNNAEILRLDFDVSGGTGSINLNSIQITAVNSSDADIASSGVKLYRTTTTTFSTANQLGTAQSLSSSSATFSSLNYSLPGGTTYIWAVYDIASGATRNNTVDMSIGAGHINVSGSTYPSSSESPTGSRTINFKEWDGSVDTDWRNNNNWTPSGRPSSTDNVVIPSSPTNQPHLYDDDNGNCNNITINSGATLTVESDNSKNLTIYGSLINNGTLDESTGTRFIRLRGTGCTIEGSGTFTNIYLRIRGGNYSTSIDLSVVDFNINNTGKFYLGSHSLTISGELRIVNSDDELYIDDGTIDLTGSFADISGLLSCGINSTFYYNGDNNQNIRYQKTYYNLKVKTTTGTTRDLSNRALQCTNLELISDGGTGTAQLRRDLDITGNIIIGSSTTLSSNSRDINLEGSWTNNGSFTQGSDKVTFDGSSAQTIGGSTATTFYDLTTNKSGGEITLNKTTNVSHTLALTSGIINTTSSNLLIFGSSATAFSGGSNTSHIDGPARKDGSSDFVFPVGDGGKYARIGISSLSGADNFTAEYHKAKPSDNENYAYPITKVSDNEYWDLNRAGSSVSASVTLHWEDSKWSGIGSFSELKIMHYGTSWVAESGTYTNSGSADLGTVQAGSLTVSGVSSFSPFSFGTTHNQNNTLPVSLLEFNISKENNTAILNWKTASEENNDYFIIERSQNGIDIKQIGVVNGAGNSNELLNYSFIDDSPLNGISYYRLTQVDFDGKTESFDWKMISFVEENQIEMLLYPNPISNGNLNIEIHNIVGKTQIRIFDNSSRIVYNKNMEVNAEMQKITMPISFPKGVYFVQLINSKKTITKKLLVN